MVQPPGPSSAAWRLRGEPGGEVPAVPGTGEPGKGGAGVGGPGTGGLWGLQGRGTKGGHPCSAKPVPRGTRVGGSLLEPGGSHGHPGEQGHRRSRIEDLLVSGQLVFVLCLKMESYGLWAWQERGGLGEEESVMAEGRR